MIQKNRFILGVVLSLYSKATKTSLHSFSGSLYNKISTCSQKIYITLCISVLPSANKHKLIRCYAILTNYIFFFRLTALPACADAHTAPTVVSTPTCHRPATSRSVWASVRTPSHALRPPTTPPLRRSSPKRSWLARRKRWWGNRHIRVNKWFYHLLFLFSFLV